MDIDTKSFVGGSLGGLVGIVSSYPLDTIKVRIQSQQKRLARSAYSGAWDCLFKTVRNESVLALYKGVSSPLIGSMFINSILFGVEKNVRRSLTSKEASTNSVKQDGWPSAEQYKLYGLSGALAGFIQSFLLSPIELIKIRMQLPNSSYSSTWHCVRELASTERYGAHLARGTLLTIIRDVPAVTTYFVGFEYACALAKSYHPNSKQLSFCQLLAAGGFAGCLSWMVTYPIDVVKTRYQADESYKSMWQCVRRTLYTEGFLGFWRGLTPTLIRAFPNNAAMFATVNWFNNLVGDDSESYELESGIEHHESGLERVKYLLELNEALR